MQNSHISNFIMPFFKDIEILLENFETEALAQSNKTKSFPPTDISIISEDETGSNVSVIEMAVAGFDKEDITFEIKNKTINGFQKVNVLTVYGKKSDKFKEERTKLKKERKFILEGISYKSFKKEFIVFENIEKVEPELKNGILTIKIYEKKQNKNNLKIEFKNN